MNSPLAIVLGAALTAALTSPAVTSPVTSPRIAGVARAQQPAANPDADADTDSDATEPTPAAVSSRREPLSPEDVSDTRLMIGSTARALGRGEVYVDVLTLLLPSVQVGVSDRVSVGIGAPVIPFIVTPADAVWFTPKVQVFRGQRTQAAIGLIHGAGFGVQSGLVYGVITRGSSDAAVTVGLGLPYVGGRVYGSTPSTLIGGERRISARTKLMTENYVLRGQTMLSGGLRFVQRRRTLDVQAIKVPGIPQLGGTFRLTYRLRDPKPRP